MKIALLTPEYVTESNFDGGLANYLQRIAIGMKQRGHEVEIFTQSERNETITHQGIIIHRIKPIFLLFELLNKLTLYRFKKSMTILSLSYALRKMLIKRHRKIPFDVIQPSSYTACGLFLIFSRPAPIVTRVSSYEPLWRKYYQKKLTFDQRLSEWLEKIAVSRSDAIYAPSKLLSHALYENHSLKVDILPPPFFLDTDNFDETIYKKYLFGKRYFLFYGTLGILKGGEVLARVLPIILAKFPEFYFVIVGKDTHSVYGPSMLQNILERTGNYHNMIIYLGVLKHDQLYPIIKYSQAVVLPSLIDNLPNTMLESMSFGKVIIGTKDTSFEELIVDGVSGILVKRNDIKSLSQAMQKVWRMSDEEKEMIGRKAKDKISTLSSDKISIRTEKYYKNVIIRWNYNI